MILADGQETSSCLPNCQNSVHLVKGLLPQVISLYDKTFKVGQLAKSNGHVTHETPNVGVIGKTPAARHRDC